MMEMGLGLFPFWEMGAVKGLGSGGAHIPAAVPSEVRRWGPRLLGGAVPSLPPNWAGARMMYSGIGNPVDS